MKISKTTFKFLAFGLCAVSAFALNACGEKGSASKAGATQFELASDIPEGSKTAKVVMVEYASVMCSHCADFEHDIMPSIKKNYVETGKVRYVFREFPTGPIELASAGHLLGRCVSADKRPALIGALMGAQREIMTQAQAGGVKQAFLTIAASAGMGEADFDKCMQDQEKLKTLVDIRTHAIEKDKVEGTPTIFINGVKYEPDATKGYQVADISKALDAALASAK